MNEQAAQSAEFIRGYQTAVELAAKACDRRVRVGLTGPASKIVLECRARILALKDTSALEAFDRAFSAAFKSGAASAAYDVRQLQLRPMTIEDET